MEPEPSVLPRGREREPADSPHPLRLRPIGISRHLLEQLQRSRRWPFELVDEIAEADVVLTARQRLGRDPEERRQAQRLGLPILVIKSDTLPQIQRGVERLLERRRREPGEGPALAPVAEHPSSSDREDALAALEECRLAVEQVVLPHGRPVELLPRSERVRQMQAELVGRYRLRSAVFGRGVEQRLRVFPA